MAIVILVIVLVLLAGLVLGPVGFFTARAAMHKAARAELQLYELSVDVEGLRTRLTRLTSHNPGVSERAHQGGQALYKPASDEPADPNATEEAPDQEKSTTRQQLLNRKEQQQADELEKELTPPVNSVRETEPAEAISIEVARDEELATTKASEPTLAAAVTPPVLPTKTIPQADTSPTRRLTIEEVLAGKVFVWIGAIALVLTAAFLLKLGFDENIITEPVRVIGAALFGVGLWCVGEWARSRVGLIAQALCGAAVAVLYASVLAGHNLYGLFGANGEAIAFGLMGIVTTAAIMLSLRHGPAVAILGMLGGFMLPPILNQGFGGPSAGMILYLIAIEVGVLAVTGKRGWFGISAMTLLFTVIWSLGYTLIGDNPTERTLTALLVLGTAAAYLFHTARIHRDPIATASTRKHVRALSIAATCSAIGIVALLAARGGYTPRDLSMLGLVAAGTLILARLDARQLAMPFVAMGLSLLVLLASAVQSLPGPPTSTLITMAACFGSLFLIGGYACMWHSKHRRVFAAMCAIAGPSFYSIVVFAGHEAFGLRDAWWPYTLGLAGVYALATLPMLRRRQAEHDWPIALFAVLSFALVCVTLTQSVDHPRLAVCLALVSAAAAAIDLRLSIRPLRLAACVVAFASAGLLVMPGPFDMAIRGVIVFNTLLPMYALPALAFGVIAWCATRVGSQATTRNLTYLCCGTLGVMLIALTRQGFHPLDFNAEGFALYEWSTLSCLLMLAAMLGQAIADRFGLDAVRPCVVLCAGGGAAIAVVGGLGPSNPLFNPDAVAGGQLALGLLGLTLAPAALIWLWSRRELLASNTPLPSAMRIGSIALAALFIAMQLRNLFHLDGLRANGITPYECASYGLAWILFGTFLNLIAPLCTLSQTTRRAGRTLIGLGLGTLLIGNGLILNPFWYASTVGHLPVLNGLWYLYGPAMLTLALLARYARQHQHKVSAQFAGFAAIALAFMLLSMFIRHGFSGDGFILLQGDLASSERYAYSLAWVLFGGVLLIAGVMTRLDTLRYGSLAILLLAVGKVFLIDTANLDNLYRVFSFFGLGVTLIALGYLYQRLVFKRNTPSHEGHTL